MLQFFRGDYPETRTQNPLDIHSSIEISDEVSGILKSTCYDCHSMETNFPWYSHVSPISWRIFQHIEMGRADLNFSDWNDLSKRKKLGKLNDIIEELEDDEMPLKSYRRFHSEARLSEDEKRALIIWAKETSNDLLN